MASTKDSKGASYLKVNKGHTTLLIPEPLPSDSSDNTVVTLFNEENELGPTNKSDEMSELQITTPPSVSCKKTPKRKLELEFGSLSHTTPKRMSDNFRQLQNFWENKSGGKSATEPCFDTSEDCVYRVPSNSKSPIDEAVKNFDNSARSVSAPVKSAKQIALNYTQLIENVVKTDVHKPQNESEVDVSDSVFDFNESDDPVKRMTLKEFRQSESESPMSAVHKADLKSPITFDPKKFDIRKTPVNRNKSAVNTTDLNVGSPSINSKLDKSEMPPPSTIPKCLSGKKRTTDSPRSTPKLSITAPKLRQNLFEEADFSPDDLIFPSPEIGKKRKHANKKRLMSMDPCNYSQLFSPPSSHDVSDSDQNSAKCASINAEMSEEDIDSDVWVESTSQISLSNISAIASVHDGTANEKSECHNLNVTDNQNETQENDSFFDLTMNTRDTSSEHSMVDIDNISAIESSCKAEIDNQSLLNRSELCTPEILKVSGGRKRLILEKGQTTLNETLISVGDSSVDESSLNSELANVVGNIVENFLGGDESCTEGENIKKIAEDQLLETSEDSRLNEVYPELCNHAVSIVELRAVVTGVVDSNSEDSNQMNESDETPLPETTDNSSNTDPDPDNSMSTDYDCILNSPPPLHIDLSSVEDLGPQSRNTAIEVTENIEYESAVEIIDLDKHQRNETDEAHVPETLKMVCVHSLVDSRSQMYNEMLPEKEVCRKSYLSLPLNIDVFSKENQSERAVTYDLKSDKELESVKLKSSVMNSCYSPDLTCSEHTNPGTSSVVPSSRNLQCWSPYLGESGSDSEYSQTDFDTNYTTDSSDSDTVNKYPYVVTKKRNLKRPRCLVFESSDDSSDIYTPSPKVPRTPLNDTHFEFPDINEINEGALIDYGRQVNCEKSDCEYDSESEMKTLSEIDEQNLLEESYLSDDDYPESLNSSRAYCNSFKFWSPASTLSSDFHWSPKSSLKEDESDTVSSGSGELETYPVYTQSGPTILQSCHNASPEVQPEPLDLSVTVERKDNEQEIEVNKFISESDSTVGNEVRQSGLYEPICISEPCVATLEQNNSRVWKEVSIGSVSYRYEPSNESIQYATDCFNNAVYGISPCQNSSLYEPKYIASVLYPNAADGLLDEQGVTFDPKCSVPVIPGLTVPVQNIYDPSDVSTAVPAVHGLTIPLQNTFPSMNSEQISLNQSCPVSQNFNETEFGLTREQTIDELEKLNACYYGDKSSQTDHSVDGYGSAGNSPGSNGSDSENDLVKMMEKSVRNKLKKKAGSRFISPGDDSFRLSDTLKGLRPYVISGWISSTYLMALARKTDLMNDMFDNCLNEKGEICEWIVENCRITTPAVLARDLVFRLFTLEELENLNLNSLARKKRFKAIRKCVEKKFPLKLTRRVWSVGCLGLIKSSVSTLFKHRVRHVQNFLVMHGASA